MAEPRPAGLLLAAGGSTRLGETKQLVALQGQSLVRRQASLLVAFGRPVVVVTGAGAGAVESELAGLPVRTVRNEAWQAGMGGSIAAGMAALGDEPAGVAILLCDQWRIGRADLQSLCGAWARHPGRVAAASWDGRTGAPAVFPRRLFDRLRGLSGERGARGLIERDAKVVKVGLPNAAFDLDTPADLAALQRWAGAAGEAPA